MGVRLPAEYQEVEYLENSGEQYIWTDYIPECSGLSVECDYMFTASQFGDDNYLFQARSYGIISAECYAGSRWYIYCGIPVFNNVLNSVGNSLNVKHKLLIDSVSETVNIDGVSVDKTGVRAASSIYKLLLFSGYSVNNSIENITVYGINSGLRIYNFITRNNGNISANFMPCYRKSDSEPGMYELVSGTFYTNSGTGEFLIGPDVDHHISPRLMDRRRVLIARLTSKFDTTPKIAEYGAYWNRTYGSKSTDAG